MRRRDFLALSLLTAAAGCARKFENQADLSGEFSNDLSGDRADVPADDRAENAENARDDNANSQAVKDHLEIEQNVAPIAPVVAAGEELELLKSLRGRLDRVMRHIGFANFNIIGFDAAISVAKSAKSVGAFTKEELDYFEMIFARDAAEYGFYGEKVSLKMTEAIAAKDVFKSPRTGHFLYRGKSEEIYDRVRKDVGDTLFLTSGVRGVAKQMYLFLTKTIACGGNFSEASRSLAPAGYSYHGIGDFDVGKIGFGEKNFTQEFSRTKEYKMLMELGYVSIRYPRGNPFGVYFEPWHIEVV